MHGPNEATLYEIVVRGELDARWGDRLGGLALSHAVGANGPQTHLTGWLADQAQLHAVLTAIRDLGLTLVSVNPAEASTPTQNP